MLSSTHIQSFCPSNTYRSMSALIPAICVCQKEWTCSSFTFHLNYSVAVSVLGIFFNLKLYYFGLQILIFKSSLCYSGPGHVFLLCRMTSVSVALIIHSDSCWLYFVLSKGGVTPGMLCLQSRPASHTNGKYLAGKSINSAGNQVEILVLKKVWLFWSAAHKWSCLLIIKSFCCIVHPWTCLGHSTVWRSLLHLEH